VRAYLDTSVVVALLLREPASVRAVTVWRAAHTVVSACVLHTEAHAALAAARRAVRVEADHLGTLTRRLDALSAQIDMLTVDLPLAERAAGIARDHGLRGYDALHLAAARSVLGPGGVFASGDRRQCAAAHSLGLDVVALQP
jgi:predicted nucleic acid-binding protein